MLPLKILHIALGGCLKGLPIDYGLTGDTGGHIAYVLGAAMAQAALDSVASVSIATRLFTGDGFDPVHAQAREWVADKVTIQRPATSRHAYAEKEALAQDLPAFTAALLENLAEPDCRPDVVHAHFADAARVALAVRDRYGIPVFYTPHSLGLLKTTHGGDAGGDLAGHLGARVSDERLALASADGIIVSSRDEAERQVAAYAVPGVRNRLHLLPPGPPPGERDDRAASLEWLAASLADPARPMVLAVARPVVKKNLAALAQAFAGSKALRASANLVILAGQPDRREPSDEERLVLRDLDAALADPELAGRVLRRGHHTHAEVRALYRAAARTRGVFVNPALHEPFGLTLLEAAEAGLPVVATRNGGPADIVGAIGHGLLVDPSDPGAIAEACLRIIGDAGLHRELRRGALLNRKAYSWSHYATRSLDLYAAGIANARTAPSRPRLVVCDLDNTLTGCHAAAARFVEWSRRRDVGFIVATGRSLPEAQAVIAEWGLPEPDGFITSVGTIIHRRTADGDLDRWTSFQDRLDDNWHRAAVLHAIDALGLASQGADAQGPHKLSYFGSVADAAAARGAIAAAGLASRVVHSHGRYIDILAPGAGKGAAVKAYARDRGYDLADCAAAGDSGNDADMLEACGFGIVVGNASEELSGLTPRPGLMRVAAAYADGVLEGLAMLDLVPAAGATMAA